MTNSTKIDSYNTSFHSEFKFCPVSENYQVKSEWLVQSNVHNMNLKSKSETLTEMEVVLRYSDGYYCQYYCYYHKMVLFLYRGWVSYC